MSRVASPLWRTRHPLPRTPTREGTEHGRYYSSEDEEAGRRDSKPSRASRRVHEAHVQGDRSDRLGRRLAVAHGAALHSRSRVPGGGCRQAAPGSEEEERRKVELEEGGGGTSRLRAALSISRRDRMARRKLSVPR